MSTTRAPRLPTPRLPASLLAVLLAFAPGAIAQQDAAQTTVIPGSMLEEILRQQGGDTPIRVVDSPSGNYGVYVLSAAPREAAANGDVVGFYHREVGEIYHVLSGTGTFVTAGELVNPVADAPDSVTYLRAGPGERGTLRNPQLVEYGPGSIFIVPPGAIHSSIHEVFTRTDYIIYRFDPQKVTPLH